MEKTYMYSVIVGIFAGLYLHYKKQYRIEKEAREEAEWEMYEELRKTYGVEASKEKMYQRARIKSRKKHRPKW